MTEKRQRATKAKCKCNESITKQSIFVGYIFSRRSIWVLLELVHRWTQHFTKIDQGKQNWTNLLLEPHDYRICYVNIDICHQYVISATESQIFLLGKHPQQWRARRNDCFHRLITLVRMLWSFIKFFKLILWGNLRKSVWRIYRWILGDIKEF